MSTFGASNPSVNRLSSRHSPYRVECGASRRKAKCGHVSQENRPNKGLTFECKCCGYKLHADLVGARNVALRALLVRQDWMSTVILSASPNVSGVEAKAKNLQRFLELRWSLDASPDPAR